jgi:hypothetical protein
MHTDIKALVLLVLWFMGLVIPAYWKQSFFYFISYALGSAGLVLIATILIFIKNIFVADKKQKNIRQARKKIHQNPEKIIKSWEEQIIIRNDYIEIFLPDLSGKTKSSTKGYGKIPITPKTLVSLVYDAFIFTVEGQEIYHAEAFLDQSKNEQIVNEINQYIRQKFTSTQKTNQQSTNKIDHLALLEKMADLHQRGIISKEEFETKKRKILEEL